MKAITTALLAVAALAGCAEKPDLAYMSRQEVSEAITECENAGQRAALTYTKAKWGGKNVPVVVDVQCAPRGPGNYRVGLQRDE